MRGRANRTRLAVVGIIGLVVVAWFMLVRFNVVSSWGWRQPKPDAPIVDVPKAGELTTHHGLCSLSGS